MIAVLVLTVGGTARAQDDPHADLREVERTAARVLLMHGEATRFGENVTARCLDRVLAEVNASVRIALERVDLQAAALERGETAEALRSARLVRSARDTVRLVSTRATICVEPWHGRESERNRTIVITTIDSTVPGSEAVRERPLPRASAEAFSEP